MTLEQHSSVMVLERAVKDWHGAEEHGWAMKWVKIINATIEECVIFESLGEDRSSRLLKRVIKGQHLSPLHAKTIRFKHMF